MTAAPRAHASSMPARAAGTPVESVFQNTLMAMMEASGAFSRIAAVTAVPCPSQSTKSSSSEPSCRTATPSFDAADMRMARVNAAVDDRDANASTCVFVQIHRLDPVRRRALGSANRGLLALAALQLAANLEITKSSPRGTALSAVKRPGCYRTANCNGSTRAR